MNSLKKRLLEGYLPEPNSGCWIWNKGTSGRKNQRYGQIWHNDKMLIASRASYMVFYGVIPNGLFVCHKCDVTLCINPRHLFLGTNRDNFDDSVSKGRRKISKGEKHGNAKLTAQIVKEIFKLYKVLGQTQKQIAIKYGVDASAISLVLRRKNWKHVCINN